MPHSREQFIGAWTLDHWMIEYEDGASTYPFGEHAVGFLIYAEDGVMSATVSRKGRKPFDIVNARRADDRAKAAAFDSYFHYAGRWRVDGNNVVHAVETALNPNMVGTDQVRHAEFNSNGVQLVLSASEPLPKGSKRRHVLRWRRP